MNASNMPRENVRVLDTDPPTDVFSSNGEWFWCWHGEVMAYGPYLTEAKAVQAATSAAE